MRQPVLYVFSFFMILSLFFNGVHPFLPNTVYAQTNLVVTVTNACEFEDGDDPNDFENCLQFNDGATISFDNVRLSASSNAPVKQFICNLQRDGVTYHLVRIIRVQLQQSRQQQLTQISLVEIINSL